MFVLGLMSVQLHLCRDMLIAAVPFDTRHYEDEEDKEAEEDGIRKAGIYILYPSSLEVMKHVAGIYLCISSAANGDIVAENADGRYEVFQLDANCLVFRTSFFNSIRPNG